MKTLRIIILFFLVFITSQVSFAQRTKVFSDTAYLKEMKLFMGWEDKKDPDPVYSQFQTIWNNGQINDKQKKDIVKLSNVLLKKRAKANPHFTNFFKYIFSVLNSKSIAGELDQYLRAIDIYSSSNENNASTIDHLIENLVLLNDSGIFYQSRAVKWTHNADKYKILIGLDGNVQINFQKTDLKCIAKGDSSIIFNTSGSYYPQNQNWIGSGGQIYWERAGFSRDSVNARLSKYLINLKFSEYKADTVEFVNKKYLKIKLMGRLEEKVLANVSPERASYPKFISYDKSIDIKQVVPGIDYSGGFAMEGSRFFGYGDAEKKAELFIYKNKDLFARAYSSAFVFDQNNIIANDTRVIISIDQDTLWHPGLIFNYLIKNQRVSLTRNVGGLFKSNFYNTYHKVEVDVNEIMFDLNDSLIHFKSPPATTYRKAIFASTNFFSEKLYQEIALMDNVHPLEVIRNIAPSVGAVFEPRDLTAYLEKGESYCVNMIARLSDMGFVNYNKDTKVAYPEQKLFDYIKSHFGNKDYDAISIVSEPPKGSNAELNLKDNVLTVYGVKSFVFSNNRRVGVIPSQSTIRIKKNLEIEFDGEMQAGLAWISGKGMTFNYDSFYVQLHQVDSLSLAYQSETKNQDSVYEVTTVASTIDSISGLLRIDEPRNKAGLQTLPTYPILESHEKSYVFYEQQASKDTVYKKENFYVENYPFEIDSLNTITAKNISFKGNLNSGGVFPRFDENLVVRPDNSLGFVHKLDSSGMPIYNGLARYDNTIALDNSGLKGDGKVNYLNTSIYASKFNFFPDSMNTYASHVDMIRQRRDSSSTRYPQVDADSLYVTWFPKKDQMFINTLDKPFNLYENKADLAGSLELNTKKLKGIGQMKILDTQLDSKTYTFYDESFKADTVDFSIKPVEGQKSPFLTYNARAEVDFDKKLGIFNSNGKNSYIDLPVNQYKCYMNYFSWHMGINQIDIGTTQKAWNDSISEVAKLDSLSEIALNDSTSISKTLSDSISKLVSFADTVYSAEELALNSKFISTHPSQDSLMFYAASSSYDIKNFIINARGVKFIRVADAFIFPSDLVTILPEATIKTLTNSRILANNTSRFHKFYDASVDIFSAKRYSGSGDYEYYNRQDSLQIVHFSQISVNTDFQTIASGTIEEKDLFYMSPEFAYFGKISLKAPEQFIEFDGYTKISHSCEKRLLSYWLQFKSVINPDSIVIPIAEQPVDNEFRKLQSSLFLTADSMGVYPGFLTTKKRFTDNPVLEAKGFLYYNVNTGYYEITDSTKLQNPEKEGNYLSFHKNLCILLGEGKMDLGVKLGQVQLTPVGFLRYNSDAYQTQLDVMLGVDFFFHEPALNMMASKINESISLPPVNTADVEYQRAFKELVGLEQKESLMKDFALMGGFSTIPQEMNHTLFFSELKLKWNNAQNAWQSDGKIGLGNLKGVAVNKLFDGYVEVKKAKSGDILNIYLETDPKNWYFFTYTRGTLKTISSDNDYNNLITNLKDKYRKSPLKDEENPYMFFPATDRAKDNFIDEMKKQKLAALNDKDLNLDNSNTNENRNSTETESNEDELPENEAIKNENLIKTEELKSDEVKQIEELKSVESEKEEVEESDENKINNEIKTEEVEKDSVNAKNKNQDSIKINKELKVEQEKKNDTIKNEELKKDKEIKKEPVEEEIKLDPPKKEDYEEEEESGDE